VTTTQRGNLLIQYNNLRLWKVSQETNSKWLRRKRKQRRDVFVETADGFVQVEAKAAAVDCGSKLNPKDYTTHAVWRPLWVGSDTAAA
jgi:hypothetical protein